MNSSAKTVFSSASHPQNYEVLREDHEISVLGAPSSQGTVSSTVINIRSDTAVPDHVVWSLFNTLFFNWCCLGFVAYAYSVKVCGVPGSWAVGGLQALPGGICGPWV